jgi:hypothetical protein
MITFLRTLSRAKQIIKSYSFWIVVIVSLAAALYSSGAFDLKLNELAGVRVIGTTLTSESLIDTILASLATIIAVYFSISILAIQNAASNYTASILEYYKEDGKSWVTYLYLVAGLSLCGLMLNQKQSAITLSSGQSISLLNAVTVLLITSFFVLALQFLHICDLVSPRTLISNAKIASLRDIKKAPSKVSAIQKATRIGGLQEMAPPHLFREFVFHQNEATVLKITHEKLLEIIDIINKSAVKRETETYSIGLSAVAEIADNYVSLRESDATPDDKFLQEICDKLVGVSRIAFDNRDTPLLQTNVRTLEKVGISTTRIRPLSRISGPNQLTAIVIWHIHELGTEAIQRGLWDGAAQSVWSIQDIGIKSIEHNADESLASSKILSLGMGGVIKREWPLTTACLGALSRLLFQSVLAKSEIHKDPSRIMETIERLAVSAIENKLDEIALASLFPILSETSLGRTVSAALTVKNEKYPDIETAYREGYAKQVVSRLLECIHKIAAAAAKSDSPLILRNIFECIGGMNDLLLKESFKTVKDGFREELLQGIRLVGSCYITRTERIHPSFVWGEGEELLTNLAFVTLDQGQDEIPIACEKAIIGVSERLIELDKYGYDAPRLASRIAVIGVYALHTSNKLVAQECVSDLARFDKRYIQHSPSPHPMVLLQTLNEDYEKSREDWRRDQKWEQALSQVTVKELNTFINRFRRAKRRLR